MGFYVVFNNLVNIAFTDHFLTFIFFFTLQCLYLCHASCMSLLSVFFVYYTYDRCFFRYFFLSVRILSSVLYLYFCSDKI